MTRFPGLDRWLNRRAHWLLIGPPMLFLGIFFFVPFLTAFKISFADSTIAVPPFSNLLSATPDGHWALTFTFDSYRYLFTDDVYLLSYIFSLRTAFISTVICLLLGYPMAYALARSPKATQTSLLMLIILPFWTSFLLRIYALQGILSEHGLLAGLLHWVGLIDGPLHIMHTTLAVQIGIVYSYLPFMILPLFATLEKLDATLLEAAADLGTPPWRSFVDITLPLSLPGVIAGCMLVFIPAIGEFVIPSLLGGPDSLMIGRVLWDEFFANHNWPAASAVATAFLVLLVGPIALYQYYNVKDQTI
jgi:putrescine transport system permease protein